MKKIYALFIISLLSSSLCRSMAPELLLEEFESPQKSSMLLIPREDPYSVAYEEFISSHKKFLIEQIAKSFKLKEEKINIHVLTHIQNAFTGNNGKFTEANIERTYTSECAEKERIFLRRLQKKTQKVQESGVTGHMGAQTDFAKIRKDIAKRILNSIKDQISKALKAVIRQKTEAARKYVYDRYDDKTLHREVADTLKSDALASNKQDIDAALIKLVQKLQLNNKIHLKGPKITAALREFSKLLLTQNPQENLEQQAKQFVVDAAVQRLQDVERERIKLQEKVQKVNTRLASYTTEKTGSQARIKQEVISLVRLTRNVAERDIVKTLKTTDDFDQFLLNIQDDIEHLLSMAQQDDQFLVDFKRGLQQESRRYYICGPREKSSSETPNTAANTALEQWNTEDHPQGLPLQLQDLETEEALIRKLGRSCSSQGLESDEEEHKKWLKRAREAWEIVKQFCYVCSEARYYKFPRPTLIEVESEDIAALRFYPSHHSAESSLCIVWKTEDRKQFDITYHTFKFDPSIKCPKRYETMSKKKFDAKHCFPAELCPASILGDDPRASRYIRNFCFELTEKDQRDHEVEQRDFVKWVIGIAGMLSPEHINCRGRIFENPQELVQYRDAHPEKHGIFVGVISNDENLFHLKFHKKVAVKQKQKKKNKKVKS